MRHMNWMIYGATGYTGALSAEWAVSQGLRPVLAARRPAPTAGLAQQLGLDHRVFGLDDPAALAAGLDGIDLVAHMAGPFSGTSAPMVDACLATGTHYIDITGEIGVFEAVHRRSQAAALAGVVLLPGAGFDVVPTDCMAALLAEALPGATHLELAFRGLGQSSRGTTLTAIEGLGEGGGAARIEGRIRKVPAAWKVKEVPFPRGVRTAVSIPWGDVSTAFYSTGIPNITTYMALPPKMIGHVRRAGKFKGLLGSAAVQAGLKWWVRRTMTGPDPAARAAGSAEIWGQAWIEGGRRVEATLTVPEGYTHTAHAACEIARRILEGGISAGAHTPSSAFGPGFVGELPGCELGEIRHFEA